MTTCSDCIRGSLDEGTPKGTECTIAGVACYISRSPASVSNGCAIILATDIFGYKLINARLIADALAQEGYCVAIPDYFRGDPMKLQLLEVYESLPSRSFLGKIAGFIQLLGPILTLSRWLRQHPFEYAVEVVTALAAALRQEQGFKRVGLQGYCYGGTVGLMMAANPEAVDAVCIAHPGKVKLPEDVQAVQVPMLFTCAEHDAQFPASTRTAAQQLLEEQSPGLATFILYPGTKHGFAVRGSRHDAAVNAARQDALQRGLHFFNQHLAGVAPPQHKLDSAGPAPVGLVLTLAPRAC